MQVKLPKDCGFAAAEVAEVLSDTQLLIKKEFAVDSDPLTPGIQDKIVELSQAETLGMSFKKLPVLDHREMYQHVHECLLNNGCMAIFPEGWSLGHSLYSSYAKWLAWRWKSRPYRPAAPQGGRGDDGPGSDGC